MSKGLTALEYLRKQSETHRWLEQQFEKEWLNTIERELKALELIKGHILSRDMDTSGIYIEWHYGHYEPYYTIEIKEGAKQIVSKEECDLLKEVLL